MNMIVFSNVLNIWWRSYCGNSSSGKSSTVIDEFFVFDACSGIYSSEFLDEFGFAERRMILSATISVFDFLTHDWSSHVRVLRYHQTYTFFPLEVYFSMMSASHRHATIEWYSVSSWSWSFLSFHFLFVAMENVATFCQFGVSRISASAVMFQMISALFNELLMCGKSYWIWILRLYRKFTESKSFFQKSLTILRVRLEEQGDSEWVIVSETSELVQWVTSLTSCLVETASSSCHWCEWAFLVLWELLSVLFA